MWAEQRISQGLRQCRHGLGDAHISLDMILQTRREVNLAEIVLVTHEVVEHDFYQALERIKKIDSIRNISNVIRVLERS